MEKYVAKQFLKEAKSKEFRERYIMKINEKIETLKEEYKKLKITRMRNTIYEEKQLKRRSADTLKRLTKVSSTLTTNREILTDKLQELELRDRLGDVLRNRESHDQKKRKSFQPDLKNQVHKKVTLNQSVDSRLLQSTHPHLYSVYKFSQVGNESDKHQAREVVSAYMKRYRGSLVRKQQNSRKISRVRMRRLKTYMLEKLEYDIHENLDSGLLAKRMTKKEAIERGKEIFSEDDMETIRELCAQTPREYETDIGIADTRMKKLREEILRIETIRTEKLAVYEMKIKKLTTKRDTLNKSNMEMSTENNKLDSRNNELATMLRKVKAFLGEQRTIPDLVRAAEDERKRIAKLNYGINKIIPVSKKLELETGKRRKRHGIIKNEFAEMQRIVDNIKMQVDSENDEIMNINARIVQVTQDNTEAIQGLEKELETSQLTSEELDYKISKLEAEIKLFTVTNNMLEKSVGIEEEEESKGGVYECKTRKRMENYRKLAAEIEQNNRKLIDDIAFVTTLKECENFNIEKHDFLTNTTTKFYELKQEEVMKFDKLMRIIQDKFTDMVHEKHETRESVNIELSSISKALWKIQEVQEVLKSEETGELSGEMYTSFSDERLIQIIGDLKSDILAKFMKNDEVPLENIQVESPYDGLCQRLYVANPLLVKSPEMELEENDSHLQDIKKKRVTELQNITQRMNMLRKRNQFDLNFEMKKLEIINDRKKEHQRKIELNRTKIKRIIEKNEVIGYDRNIEKINLMKLNVEKGNGILKFRPIDVMRKRP